jgi:hydrogenase maturation factor HypE
LSIRTSVKQMLVRQQDKKYEAELAKLRVTYAQWAAEQEKKIAETVVTEIGERAGLAEFVIYRQQKGCGADQCVFCEASGGRDRLWR